MERCRPAAREAESEHSRGWEAPAFMRGEDVTESIAKPGREWLLQLLPIAVEASEKETWIARKLSNF